MSKKDFVNFMIKIKSRPHCFVWLLYLFIATYIAGAGNLSASGLTVGDALLKMPLSAESAALGSAKIFDSKATGNPAWSALVFSSSTKGEMTFGYTSTALGAKILEASGMLQKGNFTLGIGFYQQNAGSAEVHRLPFETTVEEVMFTRNLQTDNVLSFMLAYKCADNFSLGFAPRYLNSKLIEEYELSSFSFDVGMAGRYSLFNRRLLLTALISNIGNDTNYSGSGASSERFPLPLTYSGGISYAVFKFADIMFYWDYLAPELKSSMGCAATFSFPDDKVYPLNSIKLYLGWRSPYGGIRQTATIIENSSLGFSVGFSEYLLNYAFVPLDNAGYTHRIGLTYRFGHKTAVPQKNIAERARISFVDGKFTEESFIKLEDIAQLLKEGYTYSVRVEGDLDNVDKVMDYFVNTERLQESIFTIQENEAEWVDVILIKK